MLTVKEKNSFIYRFNKTIDYHNSCYMVVLSFEMNRYEYTKLFNFQINLYATSGDNKYHYASRPIDVFMRKLNLDVDFVCCNDFMNNKRPYPDEILSQELNDFINESVEKLYICIGL